MKLSWTHNANDYGVETDTLGADALAYLLNYGFKQSMQDSIAGREKRVETDEATKHAAKHFGVEKPTDEQIAAARVSHAALITPVILADLHGTLQKRRDAIQAGSIRVGGSGQRLDPFERTCWEIAEAAVLAKWVKKFGKQPQKGEKATFEARVEDYLVKYDAETKKEAKRRLAYDTKAPDDFEV